MDIVLGKLKEQGYRFVTVSELLVLGGVAPASGTITVSAVLPAN